MKKNETKPSENNVLSGDQDNRESFTNTPKNRTYHEEMNIQYTLKLRELLTELPPFCRDFFRGIENTTSGKTRISYAYDLRVFFRFLQENNPHYKEYALADFKIADLECLEPVDIEEYQEYLKYYVNPRKQEETNTEKGISRKMSSLRTFYDYFFKRQWIHSNPAKLVDMPKLHEKAIIRLDYDEIAMLLDYVESCGENLTGQKKTYFEKTKYRDLAIITLLLGTGIRVSECVGLDIPDIDFKNNGIKIVRKGGNEAIVYFGQEVEQALKDYLESARKSITPLPDHENALFLSTQRRRITVRAVENLVKKYTQAVTPLKRITPHKLRSTYGTNLYRETGDIYLVADVLGHKDVNTTQKHYAAIEDDRRRKAAGVIKLRED